LQNILYFHEAQGTRLSQEPAFLDSDCAAFHGARHTLNSFASSRQREHPMLIQRATPFLTAALLGLYAAQAVADDADKGEKIVKTTCGLCHLTGTAGAPIIGSKADWAPRIAQGKATLYEHAIKGFEGKNGTMPPKGGSALSDDDIKAAVDYLVKKGS
jgi:cytochrome c5